MKTGKIVSAVLAATVSAAALVAFEGCYKTNPATMNDLVGTYELTLFTRRYTDENVKREGEEDKPEIIHDYIQEKGITAYLVVGSEGKGYYVYKDNQTPVSAAEVKIQYNYEEKTEGEGENATTVKTDNIKTLRYFDGKDRAKDYPGAGEESLGFDNKNKSLNVTYNAYNGIILKRNNTQRVDYKKVDSATNLSYVERKLGQKLRIVPYELIRFDGKFYTDYVQENDEDPYICAELKVDVLTGKADFTAIKKEDFSKEIKSGLDFSYQKIDSENEWEVLYEITVGDMKFYAYYGTDENSAYYNTGYQQKFENGKINYFSRENEEDNFDEIARRNTDYYKQINEQE